MCPPKLDPQRTRTTICGNRICYPGNFGKTPGYLELVKLIIKIVLSQRSTQFFSFDIQKLYLETLMELPNYVRIKILNTPQEFISECGLTEHTYNGWVYCKILQGY